MLLIIWIVPMLQNIYHALWALDSASLQLISCGSISPLSKHSCRGLRDCPDELILLSLHVPIRAVFYLYVDIHTHSIFTGAKINIVTLWREWPHGVIGGIRWSLSVTQTGVQLGAGSSYCLGCFPFPPTWGRVLFFIRSNPVQCS